MLKNFVKETYSSATYENNSKGNWNPQCLCLEEIATAILNPNPDIEKMDVTNYEDLERFF